MLRKIYGLLADDLLRSSWRSVVRLWKPMAGWTLLVYLVFTALAAPLFVAFLEWTIFRGERLFVGNEDLYGWLLSPEGFLYLFVLILIGLSGIVIRYAGLCQIITDDLLGYPVTLRNTLLHILPRVPVLIKICVVAISGFLLLLVPLLAGWGIIYQIWLTEFDLNYYWIITPPEWYTALTWAGVWTGIWLIVAVSLAASAVPALPALLTGTKSAKGMLKQMKQTPRAVGFRFAKGMITAAGLWIFFRVLSDAALFTVFFLMTGWVEHTFESLRPLAVLAGGYVFSSLLLGGIVSFFGFSFVSAIITKFYYQNYKPGLVHEVTDFKNLTRKKTDMLSWWFHPLRASLLILLITAGSVITSLFMTEKTAVPENDLLVIAHRANAGGAPENSLPGLEYSIEAGADIVEIDVQMTADGTVVVLHDEDLMRTAGDPRRLTDITYNELRELRLHTAGNVTGPEFRIPALAEYLKRSKGRIDLMIELKYYGYYPELAEKTVELIKTYGMEGQVSLKSLNIEAVRQIQHIAPALKTGYVSAVALGDISRLPMRFLSVNHTNITPQLIRRAHAADIEVYAWTVNHRDSMAEAILRGADGIITDEPETLLSVSREIRDLSGTERMLLRLGLLMLEE